MDTKTETLRLHFVYWMVMLTLVIIAIATDRWTLQPKFTEFLSNAATMTSLVLGLVAIFYSFIANDGMSKSLGSIGTVSNEVRSVREEISRQILLVDASTKASDASAGRIEYASAEVGRTVGQLSKALAAIQTHTESLHGSLENLPSRLDRIESTLADTRKAIGAKPETATQELKATAVADETVDSFLRVSSLSSNLLAHACVLANSKGKPLALDPLCKAMDVQLEPYFYGFLDCMAAIKLVRKSLVKDAVRTFTIEAVHPRLSSTSRSYFISYLDRQFKDSDKEKFDKWTKALANVEANFA